MKQNKEVDMEQFYIIIMVFIDLQPVYRSFFYFYFEQDEYLQIIYVNFFLLLKIKFIITALTITK